MPEYDGEIYPVLLAGGSGTRLWPVSRELYPKQLVNFIDEDSLVQGTIKRLTPVLEKENVRIVCGQEHYHETARHLDTIGLNPQGKIISEPCGRNTAPAILLAVMNILEEREDAVLFIFPADHVIRDVGRFHSGMRMAADLARDGHIVTFGIQPGYPETGYGYIEGGDRVSEGALAIRRFVEKPDLETARSYLEAGNFFWNSGMFAFKASVIIEEFKTLAPDILKTLSPLVKEGHAPAESEYRSVPDISFDYAIMEKTAKAVVLPSDFGWSDIGSWKSLYDFLPKDSRNNVLNGDVISRNTNNCFVLGHDRLIATNHLNNIVVVETPDSIFVSDIENSRDVKEIVNTLKKRDRKEYQKHHTETHPWGSSTVLEEKGASTVVKRRVAPGAEFQETIGEGIVWHGVVVSGKGKLSFRKKSVNLAPGEAESIRNPGSIRLENSSTESLVVVETRIRKP